MLKFAVGAMRQDNEEARGPVSRLADSLAATRDPLFGGLFRSCYTELLNFVHTICKGCFYMKMI